MLRYEEGRYDAAANGWRAVIECAPDYDGGYVNLGMVYYMLDRLADARAMFEKALELTGGKDYIVLSNLGALYFDESRFAEAARLFERAVAIHDGDHAVWGNLGQAYAATNEPDKAERPFRRAIALAEQQRASDPEDPFLIGQLASYHAMLGEKRAAVELLEEAVALAPTDPNVLALIGETFEDAGERDRALRWMGRALAGGVPPSRFTNRPSLRGLIDDPRFQSLLPEQPDQ
ncbi:MAG: tetratricopeptide repeat protein [Acidobacteriota bacterium]